MAGKGMRERMKMMQRTAKRHDAESRTAWPSKKAAPASASRRKERAKLKKEREKEMRKRKRDQRRGGGGDDNGEA